MKFYPLITFAMITLTIACGGSGNNGSDTGSDQGQESSPAQAQADAPDGEKIFRTYCITCHGIDGKLELNGAKDLTLSEVPLEERITQVTEGKGLMTPFEGILTEEQIRAVAEYTMTFKE